MIINKFDDDGDGTHRLVVLLRPQIEFVPKDGAERLAVHSIKAIRPVLNRTS